MVGRYSRVRSREAVHPSEAPHAPCYNGGFPVTPEVGLLCTSFLVPYIHLPNIFLFPKASYFSMFPHIFNKVFFISIFSKFEFLDIEG